jgi:predicted O-methyltransferase YrrM
MQGAKIRVTPGIPFAIEHDDLWMASLPGMRVLSELDFVPTTVRIPSPDDTYLSRWEGAFLEGLAASCPDPARLVDIGTGKGASLCRMLLGLALHADAFVWSFDLEECPDAVDLVVKAQIPNWRYECVQSDSATGAIVVTEELDLVYVDGSHSAEGVVRDVNAWKDKLRIGGVMAFHDYGRRKHKVTAAVRDSMKALGWKSVGRAGTLIAFEKG